MRQEFADFFHRSRSAGLGIADAFIDGGEGRLVFLFKERSRLLEIEFLGFGHAFRLNPIASGCNRKWTAGGQGLKQKEEFGWPTRRVCVWGFRVNLMSNLSANEQLYYRARYYDSACPLLIKLPIDSYVLLR